MNLSTQVIEELRKIAADYSNGCSLRTDYSGRGMFGTKCIGFCFSGPQTAFVSYLTQAVITNPITTIMLPGLRSGCVDNMGKDLILYFPKISYTPPETPETPEREPDHLPCPSCGMKTIKNGNGLHPDDDLCDRCYDEHQTMLHMDGN